jgi:outer membrane lipoprotein-sorting protein
MKTMYSLILVLIVSGTTLAYSQNATEIVCEADRKMRGETSKANMEMKIIRPGWDRTIRFKSWSKGYEYSMTLVTHPANEEGQVFMKRQDEMWNWNPTINRMIKLPPSMMSQGWMGSDYTNDDMLKEASIVVDYNHKILDTETISGEDCYKIQLIPKEDAAVVWGKVIMWISKTELYELKSEFYDEFGDLSKTHLGSEIKMMSGRKIPIKYEIIPADEKKQKTVVKILEIEFNIDLQESFFSKQNMKRIR